MKLTGGKMLAQLNRKNPDLGALVSKLIDAHNHVAAQIGVDPVGQAAAPPPPQAVEVIVTGEQTNIRVVDNNPTNRAKTYFSEVHTDAQFSSPKMVVQHGATRDAQVSLPTFDAAGVMQAYHIRTYSQSPGSPPSPPVAYPTYVTMAGTTSGDLPASAGSGTSPATGTVSAQGFGAFPTRNATKSNTAVYTGGGGGGGGVGGVTQIIAGDNITISPVGGTGEVTVNSAAGGLNQLTGDVTAGPGTGAQAATVVATHLSAPLPVNQGGSGTATPSLVAGANVTVAGSWPNQTVAASGGALTAVTLRVTSGSALTTGDTKTYPQVDFAGTIVGWSLTADQAGSVSVDVWKVASSAPPAAPSIPTAVNKISASAGPSLASAQSASQDTSGLTGWTTAVAAYDVFGFSIASASTVTSITLQIWIQRS